VNRRRLLLARIIAAGVRALPADRREWGRAMAAEAHEIESTGALARWAIGLCSVVLRTRARQVRARWRIVGVAACVLVVAGTIVESSSRVDARRQGLPERRPFAHMVIVPATARTRAVIGRAGDGAAYGPSIHRLRDLTAVALRCAYAHGATRHAIGGSSDSFTVTGTSPAGRRICAPTQAAAEAIQHTQAYADDAAATALLVQHALQCVRAQGISLSGPGVAVAERVCKARIETHDGIREPAPLP
jgi:hypothetical protein